MKQQITNDDTIFGVFDNDENAQEIVSDLKAAGFNENQIGIIKRTETHTMTDMTEYTDGSKKTAEVGAVVGAGTGTLWGLGILAGILPGIGPAIVGGTLGVLLSNAVVGASVAGLGGALVGLGISENDADAYEKAVNKGQIIVTVNAGDRAETARAVFSRGPY